MLAYKEITRSCRTAGFLGRVRGTLLESLEAGLPPNAHDLANER
jgi:hypothetical protein